MKFNFEKTKNIKDLLRKTVIGAGIIAASTSTLEAQNKNYDKDIDVSKKIELNNGVEENKDNPEFYRNEYIKYMEHPSYKERLAKEMYGDIVINEEMQKDIDREYKERVEQIKKVSVNILKNLINYPSFTPFWNKIETDEESVDHEFSHSVDSRLKAFMSKERGFNEVKEQYISDPLEDYINFIIGEEPKKYKQDLILLRETLDKYIIENKLDIKLENLNTNLIFDFNKTNDVNYISNFINEFEENSSTILLEYFTPEDFHKIYNDNVDLVRNIFDYEVTFKKLIIDIYYKENTEIKARINHLRLKAIKEFGFDLNNEFNINNFSKLKTDRNYYELKNELNLSDEQINELMKYTAYNDEIENIKGTYYHSSWDYGNGKDNLA